MIQPFCKNLKKWREHVAVKRSVARKPYPFFTQKEAAEYLGVNARTYEGWERDTKPMVQDMVLAKIKLSAGKPALRKKYD